MEDVIAVADRNTAEFDRVEAENAPLKGLTWAIS